MMSNCSALPLDTVINGDCLKVLQSWPDRSVDLVVTSPPYNIRNSTGNGMKYSVPHNSMWIPELSKGYDGYDDNMPHDEYAKWQHNVLLECMRILKDDGAIFYNHKWRVQNGLLQDRSDIVYDLPLRQIIIWERCGGLNFQASYFLPTYEVIYMICKKDFKLVPKANSLGDVWKIKQDLNNPHPAPFPIELPYRIISSTNAKIILDPFLGSGTTAIAAKQLGRHYIGIELSEKYCKMAEERILKEDDFKTQKDLFSWKDSAEVV